MPTPLTLPHNLRSKRTQAEKNPPTRRQKAPPVTAESYRQTAWNEWANE
jgi:hypothetical protein